MEAVPYILRGVIVPLAIGGILAYLVPHLQSYFKDPSFVRRARVDTLRDEYGRNRQYANDTSLLITRLVFHVASLLGQLAVLILVTAMHVESLFGNFVGLILYGYIATSCLVQVNSIHTLINNFIAFNTYREKTITELKKLGGTPENLDNEETQKQAE